MSGKGSRQRPTDKAAFDKNFDAIFGKPKKKKKEKKNDKASR